MWQLKRKWGWVGADFVSNSFSVAEKYRWQVHFLFVFNVAMFEKKREVLGALFLNWCAAVFCCLSVSVYVSISPWSELIVVWPFRFVPEYCNQHHTKNDVGGATNFSGTVLWCWIIVDEKSKIRICFADPGTHRFFFPSLFFLLPLFFFPSLSFRHTLSSLHNILRHPPQPQLRTLFLLFFFSTPLSYPSHFNPLLLLQLQQPTMGCSGSKGVDNGSSAYRPQQHQQHYQQQQQYAVNIPPSTLPQGWYACTHFSLLHTRRLHPLWSFTFHPVVKHMSFFLLTHYFLFKQK